MSLRDSESDFARLGASLTPRAPGAHLQQPGEQNSGLVDMRALYAASVEQVMQRAQAARARPPVVAFQPVAFDAVAFDPVAVDEEPMVLPRQGSGWLPVVAVLMVLAAAGSVFVVSTTVPEVVRARTMLVPAAMRAKTIVVDVAMRADAVVAARVDRLLGRPVPVAIPVSAQPPLAPAAPPVAPAPLPAPPASQVEGAAAPIAIVDAKTAPASTPPARAPVPHGQPRPQAAGDTRSTMRAPRRPVPASPPAMAATPAKPATAQDAPPPATAKVAADPAKAAPAAGGADSKPMSLDDMIRRAVEAESKRKP
jgi:hypothetical protein